MTYPIITPPESPVQHEGPLLLPFDAEVDTLINVIKARQGFKVTGKGLTVAVFDTGLRTTHVDFKDKVLAQRNYTADNGGDEGNATDGQGHGTNVGGIIVANTIHTGVAPGASIVPIKVLGNQGGGGFEAIEKGLDWVLANHAQFNISVVNMSLGSSTNDATDEAYATDGIRTRIKKLKGLNIPTVVAAGNDYFKFKVQGMAYPAIFRECVSVGAVYDSTAGSFSYRSGAVANSSQADQITPFSQRLSAKTTNSPLYTDIFAPGAPVTSSGILSDEGESTQQGTSQATPVVSGVILLMQEFFKRATGKLPPVDLLVQCMRVAGVSILDGDNEDDNVPHTKKRYRRVDANAALGSIKTQLQKFLLQPAPASELVAFSASDQTDAVKMAPSLDGFAYEPIACER